MKITQICYGESADERMQCGTLFALTDDGKVFMLMNPWEKDAKWQYLKPLNPKNMENPDDYIDSKPNIKAKAKV